MEFTGREHRTECYLARDTYFECIEKQPVGGDPMVACKQLHEKFLSICGSKWTEHFIRRRDYLKFKEKLEKGGVDIVDKEKI